MSFLRLPNACSAHINIEICTDGACPGPLCRRGNTRRHFLAVSDIRDFDGDVQWGLLIGQYLVWKPLIGWNNGISDIDWEIQFGELGAPGRPLGRRLNGRDHKLFGEMIFQISPSILKLRNHGTSRDMRLHIFSCHPPAGGSSLWQHQNSVITLERHLNNVTTHN